MSLLTHGFNGGQIEQVISNSNNRMDVINTIGNLKCNIGDLIMIIMMMKFTMNVLWKHH